MENFGEIKSLNISKNKGEAKLPVNSVNIMSDGIENDAHKGNGHRQVSMLSCEDIKEVKKIIPEIKSGDFAENITVAGIDFAALSIGDSIEITPKESFDNIINSRGTDTDINYEECVILEITQIGKECHTPCSIFSKLGYCIMPKSGIFCKVIKGGKIFAGDKISIIKK